ncbi:hypothetical protein [Runella salmonicolor]|uniref:Uncharacterized protein n=1 Tax=Runella salmonicolor TaxID=2950278 RepID=A0ABT1FMY2_9BACT|nr:hypothetical protein [Runella salmonicolor]MCP1383097.1 hypothetical protein [Runella salmonicolor]
MKIYRCVMLFFMVFIFTKSTSQNKIDTSKASIVLKLSYAPFVGETVVFGKIITTSDSLFFNTTPCNELAKKLSPVFPCNAHLIKPIGVSFKEIKKMKRRAFLFLFPNRLFIQTKSNDTYLFITYKRRLIKRKYQAYLDSV